MLGQLIWWREKPQRWESRIEFVGKAQRVDGKSILDLLTLAAEAGTHLVVEATGSDASECLMP